MIDDAIITNENDELYDLQKKYNVKISRSNSSDAIYIFRTKSKKLRIGHPISKEQNHLMNFKINISTRETITKAFVDMILKQYQSKL